MRETKDTPNFEYPEDGPWKAIERTGDSTTYYPRQSNRQPRYEWILPSGRTLIDDFHAGLILRMDYHSGFDWNTLKVKGRALGDRAIMRRQTEGEEWFVLSYQERYDETDELTSSELIYVEQYQGKDVVRSEEVAQTDDSKA